jgi:hypothetical protein
MPLAAFLRHVRRDALFLADLAFLAGEQPLDVVLGTTTITVPAIAAKTP